MPKGFEYFNPEDEYVDAALKHLRLIKVETFAFAGEEVHGDIVHTPGSQAAIHDLGKSRWLRTFNPAHLENCSHFQIRFYDEVFDVVCRGVEAGRGPYNDVPLKGVG